MKTVDTKLRQSSKDMDGSALPTGAAFRPLNSDQRNKLQKPSFYADPVSWLMLEAAEQAVGQCIGVTEYPEDVGVITVSDVCTIQTMTEIASRLMDGYISPLRFSGANPGAVGSLPSHFWSFSGPTLVFSMLPEEALGIVKTTAGMWLQDGSARHVIVNRHWMRPDGHHARSTIFSHSQEVTEWLD